MIAKKTLDWLAVLVGLVGLIPIGLLAFMVFQGNGAVYEDTIRTEWARCPKITDCTVPQQCRINLSTVKYQYIQELNGGTGLLYEIAGYPTIKIGYPQGTPDEFLIPACEH